jgi:xanthine/uracil permease
MEGHSTGSSFGAGRACTAAADAGVIPPTGRMTMRLVYLRTGLAVILCFVGLKMLLAGVIHIPVAVSLAVIVACLSVTTWAGLRATHRRKAPSHSTVDRPLDSIISKP